MEQIKEKLEYLRGELRAGTISYGELFELQELIPYIEEGDTELLEAAGVPETENETMADAKWFTQLQDDPDYDVTKSPEYQEAMAQARIREAQLQLLLAETNLVRTQDKLKYMTHEAVDDAQRQHAEAYTAIETAQEELKSALGLPVPFDTIKGKTIEEVKALGLDHVFNFSSAYPIVENGIVTGIVDGNYPLEYNDGNWEIIDDYYAQATE